MNIHEAMKHMKDGHLVRREVHDHTDNKEPVVPEFFKITFPPEDTKQEVPEFFKITFPPEDTKQEVPESCAHDQCDKCRGTGRTEEGAVCVHWISCPCKRCRPCSM